MSIRIIRINELIKQELSLLVHSEFGEKYGIVEITDVNTSEDLKNTFVYVRSLEDINKERFINSLNSKVNYFNKILLKKITSRNVPRITFVYDNGIENVNKVDELLTEIEKENVR